MLYFIFSFLLFFSLLFWAMWLKGSWCPGRVSGLSPWGGRAKQDIRPPETSWPHIISSARAVPETSVSRLRPRPLNNQQAAVLDTPCQTTSKTGTQPHPLAETLPKIIISSEIPQNTPPDMVLPTRKITYSLIQQNTGTSPLHQEAYTTHWTNLTHWGQTLKTMGTTNLWPAHRRPQTEEVKQTEKTEKYAGDIWAK